MPLLQVRDFPTQLYTMLALMAERENRSITQQTVYMLKNQLVGNDAVANAGISSAITRLESLNLHLPKNAPSVASLIRKDRDSNAFSEGERMR